ncbi:hypothetical protein ADUPG1_006669 [Aduncisulcus paluster]|uniref:ENTH domain-containing protein n=1 Tax=Aduncisulcus paluster TaxID=2918883 RepID=A0ABQ5KMJ5_9EUKA|nr:hypothetical protein ADUPG1_006669 [Aduncisulcus paluster]|eukprot:gnl/Carplike_NY0171/1985_a2679_583.p1 GENE.gnl/Carplike_NY0171/1985_a2679_583~~gnl/Carplike_NY0171/1985_a2679_583.p1  ORF type:complete len:562 (-),score=138.40 gnl/Carplike_NY0171/1985_a2679_583:124-1809(-)
MSFDALAGGSQKKSFFKGVRDKLKGYSPAESIIVDLTNPKETWGPSPEKMQVLVDMADRKSFEGTGVLQCCFERMRDATGKKWKQSYKCMMIIEYLLLHASESTVAEIKRGSFHLRTQLDFRYKDEEGQDKGQNVRIRAEKILKLIEDPETLKADRAEARYIRDKVRGKGLLLGQSRGMDLSGMKKPTSPALCDSSPRSSLRLSSPSGVKKTPLPSNLASAFTDDLFDQPIGSDKAELVGDEDEDSVSGSPRDDFERSRSESGSPMGQAGYTDPFAAFTPAVPTQSGTILDSTPRREQKTVIHDDLDDLFGDFTAVSADTSSVPTSKMPIEVETEPSTIIQATGSVKDTANDLIDDEFGFAFEPKPRKPAQPVSKPVPKPVSKPAPVDDFDDLFDIMSGPATVSQKPKSSTPQKQTKSVPPTQTKTLSQPTTSKAPDRGGFDSIFDAFSPESQMKSVSSSKPKTKPKPTSSSSDFMDDMFGPSKYSSPKISLEEDKERKTHHHYSKKVHKKPSSQAKKTVVHDSFDDFFTQPTTSKPQSIVQTPKKVDQKKTFDLFDELTM